MEGGWKHQRKLTSMGVGLNGRGVETCLDNTAMKHSS